MLVNHDFINVLDSWPGKSFKGDKFPTTSASIAAKRKLDQLRGRTVVLLGSNVARAFGCKSFRYFEFYEIRNPENFAEILVPAMTIVPHPSQVNRWWNIQENRLVAQKFLRTLVDSTSKT